MAAQNGWTWSRSLAKQATLAKPFSARGIGLHGGRIAEVVVAPAAPGSGIRFVTRDATGAGAEVSASWQNREPALLCTALKREGRDKLRTIEHLMASLSAFAVDNVCVEIAGDELPIFDGSAVAWCHSILKAGIVEQEAPRRYIRILKPVEVREKSGHFLRVEPQDERSFDIGVSFPGCGEMQWSGIPTPWVFLRDIAPSRSFGLLTWGLPLKIYHLFSRQALLRGANLFTTGIVWRGKFIGGMHVEDEPVRHRVLDLMGDMMLAGAPILGRVSGYAPRHELNHMFVRAIMEAEGSWDFVELDDQLSPKRVA